MEGFYTVQFTGVQGFGFGVVTLIGGKLFGGDSGFLYTGTFTTTGNTLKATVNVNRSAPGAQNVMGQDRFTLELNGALQGNVIDAAGSIPGMPVNFKARLTKHGDLPR